MAKHKHIDLEEEIMDRAEGEHDVACAALQEALYLLTKKQKKQVLRYLDSEEE